jgi:hypothetical protein
LAAALNDDIPSASVSPDPLGASSLKKERAIMGLFEFAIVLSVTIALYNIQQIKMILKDKGFTVDTFKGWREDYRRFKGLIRNEPDRNVKIKYQKILNGLHFSLAGGAAFTVMVLINRL